MTRIILTLAAILLIGVPVCAQQAKKAPAFPTEKKGITKPIPAWNIHGHTEEIPSWMRRATVVTSEKSSSLRSWRSCVIVAKHGKKYDYIEGFAVRRTDPSQKRFSERDLKEFKAKGGVVEILPPGHSKSDLQSAENACFR